MLRNFAFFSISIILFFIGMIVYGIILNSGEISLTDAMAEKNLSKLDDVRLIVSRNNYQMELYSGSILVKSYKVVFGQGTGNVKTSKFDNITPKGNYNICRIDTNTEYHKKMYLNYPTIADAAEALKNNVISKSEFELVADWKGDCPPSETRLGADIGIQGIGKYDLIFRNLPFVFNWTNGSIAVSNDNIDELYEVVDISTEVIIKE